MPYDTKLGRFANDNGRIAPGPYAVGWARRGPTGTLSTDRTDGYAIVELIAPDLEYGSGKPGRAGLEALLASRNIDFVTLRDWLRKSTRRRARRRGPARRAGSS